MAGAEEVPPHLQMTADMFVPNMPLPFGWKFDVIELANATKGVRVNLLLVTGMTSFTLEPKGFQQFCKEGMAISRTALLGLDLPPGTSLNGNEDN
jgi:hypothetical protein